MALCPHGGVERKGKMSERVRLLGTLATMVAGSDWQTATAARDGDPAFNSAADQSPQPPVLADDSELLLLLA
jgi:hypothetical protein